jgi:transposase InsO family protein
VTPLRRRLRELAAARPRFGYRRLHILLCREGWRINAKKTYRLYREEGLGVRVTRRRKRASQLRVRPVAPTRPNERWAMDFRADRLDDGRRIRILTIEDVFTRECLAMEVDTSLTSGRVVEVLARLTRERGAPAIITVDNGSEFYARTTDSGAYAHGVRLDFSRPGKPMDNPFIGASMAACGMSISTRNCSSRWSMRRRSYWSGNGTTMRSGRTARWGRFPLGSSWPRGSSPGPHEAKSLTSKRSRFWRQVQ